MPAMGTSSSESITLVSASPRRRRLLSWLGVPFEVAAVDTAEDLDSPLAKDPPALARHLADEKSRSARAAGLGGDALVLTFDTIVVLDDTVLGKPSDDSDARRMLEALSDRSHQVVTGVAVSCPGDSAPSTFSVTTEVLMDRLTDRRIEEWMAVGEYAGCAGAYNIEGQIARVTEDQCYQNVAGLPLCHLYAALCARPGCSPAYARSPIARCDAALGRRCRLGPVVVTGPPSA